MCSRRDFDAVFKGVEYRVTKPGLLILAKENREEFDRLGIVVGNKNVPAANARNSIKRSIRETFRTMPRSGKGLDIVVVVRKQSGLPGRHRLREAFAKALDKLHDSSRGVSRR